MNRELSSIDAWLRGGRLVVTASERTARSLTTAFHRARRAEGLTAWLAPDIQDWQTFVSSVWKERSLNDLSFDGRTVLNSLQEHSLWAGIVSANAPEAARLAGARDRLASLTMEAHSLLCAHAPQFLKESVRSGWDQDAAAFSTWLVAFDETCRSGDLLSTARLPLELLPALAADSSTRPELLLAGFDRILPAQRELFAAWGTWAETPLSEPARQTKFHRAPDPASELAACALWCKRRLAANPNLRFLVIAQDVPARRGEIARAFLRFACTDATGPTPSSLFEFSLGQPLSQIALARGAGLLLHWLADSIDEHELDWLFSAGQIAASPEESLALTAFTRALRRHNLQRTQWTLPDFLRQRPGAALPSAWVARMTQARRRLQELACRTQSPLAWAELAPQLLQRCEWPGFRPLTSAEFQGLRRWQQVVDDCASLGFDGRRIEWMEFLAALDRAASETLFAPESKDAPILIAGPAESAGLTADAVWFLGADEEAWPARGATHPLLPLAVQRDAGMPHATPRLDWELAATMTRRLLTSAPEVHFSYASQSEGVEARPSRLVVQLAGPPQPMPPELRALPAPHALTVSFEDLGQVPFPPGNAPGGAATLTAQSQCACKAFAIARLGAQPWDRAEAGLNAKERGMLLHDVLYSVWGGPPNGIRSHRELDALSDLASFVTNHVRRVLQTNMPARARESMPPRYLALEESRLVNLVTEWLRYESARVPFTVLETEHKADAAIAGLQLHLRLDRIDRFVDDTLFVIDYKSGDVKPTSWDLPRPDDVQLPLYANFALHRDPSEIGGLVFAKVRPGELAFAGLVRDARATLYSDLRGSTNLVKRPLDSERLSAWRDCIEQLARDFLSGRAVVNPRDYPKTCEYCGLQSLCRVQEYPPQSGDESGEEAGDA